MPSSYEFSAISSSRDEEMSSGTEEMEVELMQEEMQGVEDFRYGIRKFRNHSENFAILAKFHYGHIFAMIAKIRYHSKNSLS